MKIEGRLLLFGVENADGSRISSDCKIDIPEKVPIVNDFNDPNNCIGSASVSIDEKGLIFTGDIPDDFDTNDYPGCGGYYTGVTYLNTTLVSMCLKCVGLVKTAVNSAYKYVKKDNNMSKVYTNANVGDLRRRFVDAVVDVFGSSEKFYDYIENEEYVSSFYDVFYSGSGECYIINRSSGEYINWYKFTHIGRDIHSTVAPDDFVKFLSDFGFLKGE